VECDLSVKRAARSLQISYNTYYRKLKRYGFGDVRQPSTQQAIRKEVEGYLLTPPVPDSAYRPDSTYED